MSDLLRTVGTHFLEIYQPATLVPILLALSAAALIKGLTGMGFSTVAVTLLALSVGLKDAIPLVVLPSLASNLIVMKGAGHFRETVLRFKFLLIAAPLGIFVGLNFLIRVDETALEAVLGVILILYCLFAYTQPQFRIGRDLEKHLAAPAGFLTAMLQGMSGAQILPVVPYVLALSLTPNQTVQVLNCFFTVCSLTLLTGLAFMGGFTVTTAALSLPALVLVFFGVKLGEYLRSFLSAEHFRMAILLLMSALGVFFMLRFPF